MPACGKSSPAGIAVAVFLIAVFFPSPRAHPAPWEMSRRLDRVLSTYDVKKVETFSGVVRKIFEKVPSNFPNRHTLGFHCTLETERETFDVHLGPVWYVKSLEGRIAVGDTVQVTGSASAKGGENQGDGAPREILASEVRKDGEVVLRLRDAEGKPLWSGR